MNDYKELIEELRNIEFVAYAPYGKHWGVLVDKLTVKQAADAIEQLIKERDAAVEDIKKNWLCFTCKKRIKGREWAYCKHLELEVTGRDDARTTTCENWEWRGVQG